MTNKEKLQSLSLEDLTDWLNAHGEPDNAPWMRWFDDNYCAKCESEIMVFANNRKVGCAFCENHNYCRFLGESVGIAADTRTIIKMWLEEQANEEEI